MKKSVRIAAMIFTIFAILIAVEIIISYKCLTVTDYKIKSDKIKETTKIVLISDLHNSQFGSKNRRLVDKIQKQDPDLILMDGNMIITRGLGSDKEKLPRFHNIPEIVVIRLEKR